MLENIQIKLTILSWVVFTQLTQPMPPKSRYSNKDLDTMHPQWIGCQTKLN